MLWVLIAGMGVLIVISLLYLRALYVNKKAPQSDAAEKSPPSASHEPSPQGSSGSSVKPEERRPLPKRAEPAKIVPPVPLSTATQEKKSAAEKTDEIKAYPAFNHRRAVDELGLSEEEAVDFIADMITQIDEEIPKLDTEIAKGNAGKVELIVHMLKGSAVSLGTGGIADVLMEFNAYCHTGTDMETIRSHMRDLKHYQGELKKSYA